MYELYPDQRADGRDRCSTAEHARPRRRPQRAARQGRHGVPEADAVPDVDLRQHRLRRAPVRDAVSAREMDERVEWALHQGGAVGRSKDKLKQSGCALSGGQQQRLCIARGIAVKPEVLLLDEPSSALDPISTAKIEELIAELKSDYTIVIVTHNMQQAARVSDYTAYMYLGELIEFGDDRTDLSSSRSARKPRTTSPAASADAGERAREHNINEHSSKQFDAEMEGIRSGVTGRWAAWSRPSSGARSRPCDIPATTTTTTSCRSWPATSRRSTRCSRHRRAVQPDHRQAAAGGERPAHGHGRQSRSSTTSSASATKPPRSPQAQQMQHASA